MGLGPEQTPLNSGAEADEGSDSGFLSQFLQHCKTGHFYKICVHLKNKQL